jgi:hypothetical protein
MVIHSTAMPIASWNKPPLLTAQLKLKIAEGVVPTNPAELTNDYIYGTPSAILVIILVLWHSCDITEVL